METMLNNFYVVKETLACNKRSDYLPKSSQIIPVFQRWVSRNVLTFSDYLSHKCR
jgi:hypothetical protein